MSDRGRQTTIPDKMSSLPTWYASSVTALLHDHMVMGTPIPPVFKTVRGNDFFTVPKDSRRDRGCCMEASGPLMLQLSIGKLLKARYRNVYKVDLRQAKPLHQKLAQRASMDGSLATIDLSNASDTLCKELVAALLPEDWFELLNSLRAPFTKIGPRSVRLEKFSSMGNGFTFELETILFRTLCDVLTRGTVSVFGDDIVCPLRDSDVVIAALKFFGFVPNTKKTFCDGMFRESCGGDFFNGVPVRPHFLEEPPDEPQKWIGLANGLARVGLSRSAAWWYAVDQVPASYRVFGPSHLGDLVINDDEAKPFLRWHKATARQEPYWAINVPVTRTFRLEEHFPMRVVVCAATLGVKPDVAVRKSVIGYRRGYVLAYGVNDEWLCGLLTALESNQKG